MGETKGKPSAGAVRAADQICDLAGIGKQDTFFRGRAAEFIDAHTGVAELLEALRWYVENDDINEGDVLNQFWIDGKRRAEAAIQRAEQGHE